MTVRFPVSLPLHFGPEASQSFPEVTPVTRPRTFGPLQEYYLRLNKDSPLWGPYSFHVADERARTLTREAARTGVGDINMEMVQRVGNREGDPTEFQEIRVLRVFLAGRVTMGGSVAAANSERNNT